MTQTSLWQEKINENDFAELCNGLYEREIRALAMQENADVRVIQGRLKSLNHYVSRTAHVMLNIEEKGLTPLILDVQNASWSAKQSQSQPAFAQSEEEIENWYTSLVQEKGGSITGLVVPLLVNGQITLDSIDRVDSEKTRVRTNVAGWFSPLKSKYSEKNPEIELVKANKKVMIAACAGHRWQNKGSTSNHRAVKLRPTIPTLRELLLSCAINWKKLNCL
ncbi:MAG: hypothetical protein ACPGTQ_03440 [Colwellia sp.]